MRSLGIWVRERNATAKISAGFRIAVTLANQEWSGERALPGDVPADDQRLDLRSAFIGDQGLHVAQVAHDMEVECDAVAAQYISGQSAHVSALDRAVVLGERGHRLFDLALIDEPA